MKLTKQETFLTPFRSRLFKLQNEIVLIIFQKIANKPSLMHLNEEMPEGNIPRCWLYFNTLEGWTSAVSVDWAALGESAVF